MTLTITPPFTYAHGARDIVNRVSFDVAERIVDAHDTDVWTSEDTSFTVGNGESLVIDVSASDAFVEAVTPEEDVDYTLGGSGNLAVQLSRTSGQAVQMTLTCTGGQVTVHNLKLRARSISTVRNIKIEREDAASVREHGPRSYPESIPWASIADAEAIAGLILLHYAQRRPTISIRMAAKDPQHYVNILTRTIGDRIRVVYDELGMSADFFVEHVTHTVERMNQPGRPPVHSMVMDCEKELEFNGNPFTFDKRGAGFDDGVWDPVTQDDPDTVFKFDDPVQGRWDTARFGT